MIQDATLIAVVSALTGCFVKIADIGYNYIKNKTTQDKASKELQEVLTKIRALNNIILRTDEGNIPLVYTSKRLLDQIEQCKILLHALNNNSETVTKSIDKLAEAMEEVIHVLVKLDDRTTKK
jgi:chromosome segregation ATPase